MKQALWTFFQFVIFFLTFAVGSFVAPFKIEHVISISMVDGTRVFVWDGVLLMVGLFVVILGIQAARKRLPSSASWTTLALILATVFGLMAKFGFKTTPH